MAIALGVSVVLHALVGALLVVGARGEPPGGPRSSPLVATILRPPEDPQRTIEPRAPLSEPTPPSARSRDAPDQPSAPPAPASGTAADIDLLPDYLPPSMLDELPHAIAIARLDPPPNADPSVGGKLRVRLWIDATGRVRQVTVVDTGGLPPAFPEAARAAFVRSQFRPARKDGLPVASVVTIVVDYEWPAAGGE